MVALSSGVAEFVSHLACGKNIYGYKNLFFKWFIMSNTLTKFFFTN